MNIAAGVLLIIAAILNFIGGCGYAIGGAVAGGVGEMGSEIATGLEEAGEGADTGSAEIAEGSEDLKATGAGLALWGYALWVIAGLMIAGAVFLFMKSKAGFVLVTGVLALVAEIGGILITTFGIMNVVGLIAGALTILAARSFPAAASA